MSALAHATVLPPLAAGCPIPADGSRGWVHSWDLSTGVDGPGTRLVVFLSGCPLRCLYCQNPDTWSRSEGGEETPVRDIERLIVRYRPFLAASGGGLTLSGGEPLMQAQFARRLFERAKAEGVHTALDTSGFLGRRADEKLLAATDLVLLDIKSGTDAGHRAITGRPIGPTIEFARRLAANGTNTWVRYVLVPGYTDDPAELDAFIGLVAGLENVTRVDILPFHKLGAPKYWELGVRFPLAETRHATRGQVAAVRKQMLAGGLPVP